MKGYLDTSEEVLKKLNTKRTGLSAEEAAGRLMADGKNKLKEAKPVPLWRRFLSQLADPMIIILIAAAVVSGMTAVYAGESFADVIIIMIVVLINAVLGVAQESRAEKAIAALQEIAAATSKVMRDGKQQTIRSEELVRGDIIVLEAGDAVPADGRILECASMKVEEAALTGESVPVLKTERVLSLEEGTKDVPLGDRKNMVYMGSTVVYGRGAAVVTGTGMDTEMGKIADALTQAKDNETPLQGKLSQLSRILSVRHLRDYICSQLTARLSGHFRAYGHGYVYDRREPGGGSHTGRTGGRCHHRALHRRHQYVQETCCHPEADGRGDSWVHPDHLFRQNGNADAEPDDRRRTHRIRRDGTGGGHGTLQRRSFKR